ncbi:hypothetical protein Tco_0235754 [Tanacetum coccineum]
MFVGGQRGDRGGVWRFGGKESRKIYSSLKHRGEVWGFDQIGPSREDKYCNIGDLPGFIREGNSIRYEDYEWYNTIEDSELKEEALINKRILEESMNAMKESSDDKWDHDSPVDEWKDYEHTTYIRTDTSSNQNTYNNICQIVMNHCKLKRNKDGLINTSLWEMTMMTSVI